MKKQFFLLVFIVSSATAGYEGLPKTQLLEKQLKLNLSHYSQWTRRIDGGSSSTAIKVLNKQYELLLEDVEPRTRPYINQKVTLEQEQKMQSIDEQDLQSYMLSYQYWQNFASELIEVCAQSEKDVLDRINNQR